ncbi:MAG TPA: protein kinase [Gammaproteobacteria bacterium]|nr:protein kinase [Gammaproteobacteria bacterium]
MPFSRGTRFGPYEIAALIGVGGMGEVYRATDTTLKREVAIKVLPDFFAGNADSLARFQREAEMLAALNHQNIAHIYGLERADTTTGLVMELVDGQTLADRIAEGPILMAEAMPIAMQIADALEAAHERGIVHRDLKPANIKLRPDGTVKVLDFGIAKALQPAFGASGRETQVANTPSVTQIGMILGTAAYMSPEQARGKAVDKRTDVWALGCVLYEMLAGRPAFDGEDATTTIGRVLERDVDFRALPADVPEVVRGTLIACLQKDAKKRVRDIGDVKLALEGAFETRVEHGAATRAVPAWRRRFALAAAFTAGAAVIALAAWGLWPAAEARPVTRLSMPVDVSRTNRSVAVAPDGRRVAYRSAALGLIYVRDLDAFEARSIPAEAGQSPPCFSPDGEWMAYTAGGTGRFLLKTPLSGGAVSTVAQNLDGAEFCDWANDGFVYFGANAGIMRVPAAGGTPQLVAGPSSELGEISLEIPHLLPDGAQLLYNAVTADGLATVRAVVLNLTTRERKTLLTGVGYTSFIPVTRSGASRGYLVYGLNRTVFAAPVDLRTLEVGGARPVASDVLGSGVAGSLSSAAVSPAGTLAYLAGPLSDDVLGDSQLAVVDRDGKVHVLLEQRHRFGEVAYSPDGSRVVTSLLDETGTTADLWVYDLDSQRFTRLTSEGVNIDAIWSPDGQRVIYYHADSLIGTPGAVAIRSVPADNSAEPTTVVAQATWMRGVAAPSSLSPDGKTLLVLNDMLGSPDVLALALAGNSPPKADGSQPREIAATSFRETFATFSPDGNFVAYSANESGRDEIYVVPYPGPGGKRQVSLGGGSTPRWNRNGREIFYLSADKLMSVEVSTSPAFRALTPRELLATPPLVANRGFPYDVSPDGARYLMLIAGTTNTEQHSELRVVVNWIEELEHSAAPARR